MPINAAPGDVCRWADALARGAAQPRQAIAPWARPRHAPKGLSGPGPANRSSLATDENAGRVNAKSFTGANQHPRLPHDKSISVMRFPLKTMGFYRSYIITPVRLIASRYLRRMRFDYVESL